MRFKYVGDMLIMDDKLPEDVWESVCSVEDFWDALSKKDRKKEKMNEIRACVNDYEA